VFCVTGDVFPVGDLTKSREYLHHRVVSCGMKLCMMCSAGGTGIVGLVEWVSCETTLF